MLRINVYTKRFATQAPWDLAAKASSVASALIGIDSATDPNRSVIVRVQETTDGFKLVVPNGDSDVEIEFRGDKLAT